MAEEGFPGDALVSFQCTAKIYFVCGMPSRQHSCHLSLWSVNGTHFLVLEGKGIGRKKIKVSSGCFIYNVVVDPAKAI